jgi:hypothetical protein
MKIKQYLSTILLIVFLVALPSTVFAQETDDGHTEIEISEDGTFDFFMFGLEDFELKNGDETTLTIKGDGMYLVLNYKGQLLTAGMDLEIDGTVDKNILVIAREADVNIDVRENLVAIAREIKLHTNTDGVVGVLSKKMEISGNIKRGLVSIGESSTVNFAPDTEVTEASQFNGGKGLAKIIETKEDTLWESLTDSTNQIKDRTRSGAMLFLLWTLKTIGMIIVGWLFIKVAPVKLATTQSKLSSGKEVFRSAVIGFILIPLGFIIGIFLGVSYIGWSLLIVLLAFFALCTQLVFPILAIRTGSRIYEFLGVEKSSLFYLILGSIILRILIFIPIVGVITYMFVIIVGIGALFRMKYDLFD